MKKFYAILCIVIASLTQLHAQAPQGFNYQATVRNSAGDLIVNTNVYFKFNVIQGSQTAVPIFTETHYVPTDDLGQVNLVIGQGTANTGIFSELDWSLGSYYLGIELNTGSGYVAMGTTQLLSVPYALYAENSGNSTPTTPNLETVLAENNSANNQQIKDLQDPTEAQDATTKAYIDALIANLQSQIDDLDTDNSAGSITDQDGNTYDYLTYGDQVWTVENAEMITYRDGTEIPQVTDNTEWANLTTGAWCYQNNDLTKGKLYNWYAVAGIHDNDPNTPYKEFAPEGWHVPSDAEWTTLEEHLITNYYNYDQTTTGNKIAKAMASSTGWNSSTSTGAIGNYQSDNNDSAFNAYPLGYRGYWEQGSFVNNGNEALFWSSSSFNDVLGWYFRLSFQFEFSDLTMDDSIWKQGGMQVRFVRDGEANSNAQVNPIDDVYVCSGDDVVVDFSTTNTMGTTQYSWTNDNDSTGIPLSGIGSNTLSPGGVFNTTSEPQVSTITVTPELTFQGQTTTGPSETFTVTVNPTAQVDPIADITVNSGEAVQTIMFSTFNTSDTTTYTWTNDNTSLGLASSGSGNIPYFTPNNTTTTPVVGTITVTPDFDNGALICIGPSISFTITVNPAPGTCDVDETQSNSVADFNITMASAFDVTTDGTTIDIIPNPDFENAINTSCKVAEVKKLGINTWDNIQVNFDAKLDFNSNSGIKIKVWSARANTEVRLKLEEIGNAGNNVEKFLTTSVTSGWEELTFPFSAADSDKFNKIVIFFDLNANNTDTYYFDDLKLYGDGSGTGTGGGNADGDIASNGGFESGDLDGWTFYANGGTVTLDNTEAQTGDWCVKLFASASGGLNPTLKQERKAAGSVVVGDKVQVTFSYKGSLTGESGTYAIQSFVLATNGASQIETFDVSPTATWQTFTTTYTVTGGNGGDVSGGIDIEFVAICGGVAGCTSTLYLDDISLIINP